VLILLAGTLIQGWILATKQEPNLVTDDFFFFASFTVSVLCVCIFRLFVDRKSILSLGLSISGQLTHAITGFLLPLSILGIGSMILFFIGNLEWININSNESGLASSFVLMALIAIGEELVFRGYILNNLMDSFNKWTALIISSVVFGLVHAANPDTSFISVFNIIIGGMLLGINYIHTRNLWFSILFHLSWNYYQGSILGYEVSGIEMNSLFEQDISGNPILTGGNFGFEGSILQGILCALTLVALGWVYRERYRV
jgi:uncharacterized protein